MLDRLCLYAQTHKYELLGDRLAMSELLSCEMDLNCDMDCIGMLSVFGY